MEGVRGTKDMLKWRDAKELRQIFRRAVEGGAVTGPQGDAAALGTSGACRLDLSSKRCPSV